MTKTARPAGFLLGLMGVLLGVTALAADGPGGDPKAAFTRLKALAGEWNCAAHEPGHGGDKPLKINYRVTANGSAVMETLFPGTDHEMVTMYHLDGDDL